MNFSCVIVVSVQRVNCRTLECLSLGVWTDAGHTVLYLTSTGNSKASHTSLLEYLIHLK